MWTVLWIVWLLTFLVIEGVALSRKEKNDTLSEHVWRWFSTAKGQKPTRTTQVRRFLLLAFVIWLALHFMTGGWV